jgi:UDP-N-acetyl-D-glucosamine/UDP-N-acetyl-D-galactosamine dehydrogenase
VANGILRLNHARRIAVIGLGYIGLPVALAFAKSNVTVIGFDTNPCRIEELLAGQDRTRQVHSDDLGSVHLKLTSNPQELSNADFYIITVPAQLKPNTEPDLSLIVRASESVGRVLKPGDVVVYESTMPPGATENNCIPVLEKTSGLQSGHDFAVGYSPQRINLGDETNTFATITKVVAASDPSITELLAQVYGSVVKAGIYKASSTRVAEVAKVFENIQRDVNIALMNELSAICHALNVDTADVLLAAGSKWNFGAFTPGLVGGQCLPSASQYLSYVAQQSGVVPELIMSARKINHEVVQRIVHDCIGLLRENSGRAQKVVTILGLTFKEDVPDVRDSGAADIVSRLSDQGIVVQVHDPMADAADARRLGITLRDLQSMQPSDGILLAVPHRNYASLGWPLIVSLLKDGRGFVMDVKGCLNRSQVPPDIRLWRL